MAQVGIAELKAKLSEYLARVQSGEEIVVANRGRPVARLVPPLQLDEDAETARLLDMQRRGLVKVGTGKIPEEFWKMRGIDDPEGKVLAGLLEEREQGY